MADNNDKATMQVEIDSDSISSLKAQICNAITQSITEGIGERTKFLW